MIHRLPRVAILGAGGVGGVVAASLQTAGTCELTVVHRGEGLKRLRADGLTVTRHDGETVHCNPRAVVDVVDAASAGVQDFVLVAVKAHQFGAAAGAVASMLGSHTHVVPLMNGLPFWLFHEFGGGHAGTALEAVDPGGEIWRQIDPSRVIGCMSFVAGQVEGNYARWLSKWPPSKATLTFGAITDDPAATASVRDLVSLFTSDQLPLGVLETNCIRRTVFEKVMVRRRAARAHQPGAVAATLQSAPSMQVNASINPLAALARADCGTLCASVGVRRALRNVCSEVEALAAALGLSLESNADTILARYSGQFGLKASMLQDVESGRRLEHQALVGALVELGARLDVPTPTLDLLASLLELLDSREPRADSG